MLSLIVDKRVFALSNAEQRPDLVVSFGRIEESFSVFGEQVAPASTVTLRNGQGEITEYLRYLLGLDAEILPAAGSPPLLSGRITRITDGSIVSLTIEGGAGDRLLKPLPVVRTSELGNFAIDEKIPYGYGRVQTEPLALDRAGLEHLISVGAIAGADELTRDGKASPYKLNAEQRGGQLAQVISVPPANATVEGEQLQASWRGRQNAAGPIDTAADVISDVLGLAGVDQLQGRLSALRAATSAQILAGVVGGDDRSVAELLDAITASVGAVWADGLPEFARIYPAERRADEPIRFVFDEKSAPGTRADRSINDVFTQIRVRFARATPDQEPSGLVVLNAPGAAAEFGKLIRDIDLDWVTTLADAIRLGTVLLQYLARPRLSVAIATEASAALDLSLGDWVMVADPRSEANGHDLIITGRVMTPEARSVDISAEAVIGDVPRIEVVSTRQRLDAVLLSPATVDIEGNIAVLTVLHPDTGKGLSNATAVLDTGATRRTNNQGRVQFDDVRAGPRSALITPVDSDLDPFTLEWVQGNGEA